MKKTFKKAALLVATGAMLIGTAFSAKAASLYNGQWCVENNGYWFKLAADGSTFLANTWYWIKDSDGVIRCYYFDQNGWLVTNQTIGDYTLNDQGQWVVDGVVQTRKDGDGDYATHTDLSASTSAPAASSAGKVTGVTGKTSGKKAYKATGAGDNPANATFTQAYENSSISGGKVTNNWANFSMMINGVVTDTNGSGTDFYIDSETTSNLYVSYLPLDKYAAGNTSVDAFINSYLADARGYKGGSRAGDVTLGAYSFKQLTISKKTPYGDYSDHAYIRQVEGTNYVQIIKVEQNGFDETYLGALNTIARVR